MAGLGPALLAALGLIVAWQGTWRLPARGRPIARASISILGTGVVFFVDLTSPRQVAGWAGLAFLVAWVVGAWIVLRRFGRSKPVGAIVATWLPVVTWVVLKPWPIAVPDGLRLVGTSFLAFRLSLAAMEVRRGETPMPDLGTYLAFAFFPPSFLVGPISRLALFVAPPDPGPRALANVGRALVRGVVGATKYFVFGAIVARLTFQPLLLDWYAHGPLDLLIACLAAHVYLYLNFSGCCDMMLAVAALCGVRLAENFDHPFAARNVADYWTRWHVTLGAFLRQLVFLPLARPLGRLVGPAAATAVATLVVFVLSGVWHGARWGYVVWGAWHGVGVVAAQLWARHLGRHAVFAAFYRRSRVIHAVAIALTFLWASLGYTFFMNSIDEMRELLAILGLVAARAPF